MANICSRGAISGMTVRSKPLPLGISCGNVGKNEKSVHVIVYSVHKISTAFNPETCPVRHNIILIFQLANP